MAKSIILVAVGASLMLGSGWLLVRGDDSDSGPAQALGDEAADTDGVRASPTPPSGPAPGPRLARPFRRLQAGPAESTSSSIAPRVADAPGLVEGGLDPAYLAIRKPVVDAIRSYGLAALDRRAKIATALADSGPSDEPWTRAADQVFARWRSAMEQAIAADATLGRPTCYVAGCRVSVVFADEEVYQRAARAFRRLNDPGAPHGGRVQTPGAVLADGQVEVVWIMLRPENS